MTLTGIEEQRGIAHRARHHIGSAGSKRTFEMQWPAGGAIAGRLEPDHAAVRRGNADRTAAISGMSHGNDPRRHRSGRATRRTACAHGQVPRVMSLAPGQGFGGGGQAKLGGCGLAERHRTGLLVAGDQGAGAESGR
ncbi:hypothetical protein D9M70_579170 [compost metagenome]